MSDPLTIDVVLVADVYAGEVAGFDGGLRGETVELPFSVGARLVAAGFAEPAPEPEKKATDKKSK